LDDEREVRNWVSNFTNMEVCFGIDVGDIDDLEVRRCDGLILYIRAQRTVNMQ